MRRQKLLTPTILFLAATLFLVGCCESFYDDLKGCKKPRLKFVYTADGTENVLKQYIRSAQLFVYDEEEASLLHEQQLSPFELKHGVELENFHTGKYRVVAWGNSGNLSEIAPKAPFAEARIKAVSDKEGLFRSTDSLYIGSLLLDVDALPQDEAATVPFAAAHVSLDIVIQGFDKAFLKKPRTSHTTPTTPKGTEGASVTRGEEALQGAPQLLITAAGTQYPFTGFKGVIPQPLHLEPFHPALVHSTKQDLYRARFDLFRIEEIADITLQLRGGEGAKLLKEIPLLDYAAQHEIAIRGRHEVNIPILISFEKEQENTLIVIVKPFKWGTIYIKPDGYKQ